MTVSTQVHGRTLVVTINRPEVRNAVDGPTANALADAFEAFEANDDLDVAILTGADGTFCAGADLKAIATGEGRNRLEPTGRGPMGPSRMEMTKPTIAAIAGHAVAGGLELALWCDLRVMETDAILGVFCRRWGVPLIDGGTVRLPQIIGVGRAMDLILTGRPVDAHEALQLGLVNRIVRAGRALETALELAATIGSFPQQCLRADRASAYRSMELPHSDAMSAEFESGIKVVKTESISGAQRFANGEGRHGDFGNMDD